MFCYNCGKEVLDDEKVCPECGATLKEESVEKERKQVELSPISIIGIIFSTIAALFGFIIISCSFARWGNGMILIDTIVILPALVGLGVGLYDLFNKNKAKESKVVSVISICLSSFVLIYAFIGILVFIF